MKKEFQGSVEGGGILTTVKLDVTGSGKKSTFLKSEKTDFTRKQTQKIFDFLVFTDIMIFSEHSPSSVKGGTFFPWIFSELLLSLNISM